jgi:hypothetical protein
MHMNKFAKVLVKGCAALLVASWLVCPVIAAEEKAPEPAKAPPGMEDVAIKRPKPAFVGTPKAPPAGWKVAPGLQKPEQLFAPPGTKNLAEKAPVTSSDKEPIIGKLDQITDGDKEAMDGSWVELGPGLQWVQVDLGKKADIYGIMLWHQHTDPRVYRAVVVQVSDDPDFISNVTTIFNNDQENISGLGVGKDVQYFEQFFGKLIQPAKAPVTGRYVRCYSKGNSQDDQNHYTEIEVYGIPAK